MQINSWSWLNMIYSKYFDSLKTTFKVVEVEEGDNITSKIMKGLGKFWVILGIGFIYSIIWIGQAIFGWLLPGSQAFIYLFSSSEKQEKVSIINRIMGYIGFFISVIPVIFFTWILQLLYFPFLLWFNRKEKGIFNPIGFVYKQEQNGGIFTSIISSFLLMFSISFLLLGNNLGYAVGGSSLLLFGFFVLFSCYHFYNMISKEITSDSPPEKKSPEKESPEVPIKKERKNGTNFPTSEPVKTSDEGGEGKEKTEAAEPAVAAVAAVPAAVPALEPSGGPGVSPAVAEPSGGPGVSPAVAEPAGGPGVSPAVAEPIAALEPSGGPGIPRSSKTSSTSSRGQSI
jgi:hypothetical protein